MRKKTMIENDAEKKSKSYENKSEKWHAESQILQFITMNRQSAAIALVTGT